MYKKRWMVILATVLSLLVLFSACSNSTGTSNPSESSTPSQSSTPSGSTAPSQSSTPQASPQKELLDMKLTIFTEQATDGFKAMIDKVNSNKELALNINLDVIVGGVEGQNLVKVKFASGDYPELLAQINAQWIKLNLNNGTNFLDIKDKWVENFPENAIMSEACSIDGKVIAQPFAAAQSWVMYYNRSVFKDLNLTIPKTWDQLLATCEKIKPSGITPLYFAGKDTWTLELIPQVFGLMDYEGKYNEYNQKYHNFEIKNIDRKNYIDGMYKMKDLVTKGYTNATYLSDTHPMAQEALTGGKAAMYVGLGSLSARLVAAFPDKYENIGAFAVPADNDENKDYLCQEIGKVLAATDKNKDVERVKELFNYLASKEVQLAYFEKNPDLPVSNLLSSDEIKLPPSLKDILDLRNGQNIVIEPGLTNVFNSGVDIPTGLSQVLATDNYKPEDLIKEIDDGLAKAANK